MSRPLMVGGAIAALWFATPASAADVVLLPELSTSMPSDELWSKRFTKMLGEVLTDNELVVLDVEAVRPILGNALDICPRRARLGCAQVALMSLPARLALVGDLERDGAEVTLRLDLVHQMEDEPLRHLDLSVKPGDERRAALQVALFTLDIFDEVGASPASMVDAARRMVGAPQPEADRLAEGIRFRDEEAPDTDERLPTGGPEDLLDPDLDDLLDEEIDQVLDDLSESPQPVKDDVRPRWLLGTRRAYEKRGKEKPLDWYNRQRPHAGRFLLELRGGFGAVDVSRSLLSMGALDDNLNLEAVLWEAGPVPGNAGLLDFGVGYAPIAMLDIMVLAGMHIATDEISIGLMNEGELPTFGEPTRTQVVRPYVQPRVRVLPYPVGIAKPFIVAGAQATFHAPWRFNAPTAQPFPRPPGGVLYDVLGGVGVYIDPIARFGVVVESTFHYHLGDLAKVRIAGEPVGDPPLPPQGRGWKAQVSMGVQARF